MNPAFNGVLTTIAASGYLESASVPMPFAMAFLVQPVVLHRSTREALPRDTRTSMHTWLQTHPEVLVEFALRARAFVPIVREGVLFALSHGALALGADGTLAPKLPTVPETSSTADMDLAVCLKRAGFLGRWFARAGTPATVFDSWGVRP